VLSPLLNAAEICNCNLGADRMLEARHRLRLNRFAGVPGQLTLEPAGAAFRLAGKTGFELSAEHGMAAIPARFSCKPQAVRPNT